MCKQNVFAKSPIVNKSYLKIPRAIQLTLVKYICAANVFKLKILSAHTIQHHMFAILAACAVPSLCQSMRGLAALAGGTSTLSPAAAPVSNLCVWTQQGSVQNSSPEMFAQSEFRMPQDSMDSA